MRHKSFNCAHVSRHWPVCSQWHNIGPRISAVPGVPHWAQPYLGVACLLHMLWFFTALMWLAAVYLRTSHHRHDELSRALAKQEAVHAKACLYCHAIPILQALFIAVM